VSYSFSALLLRRLTLPASNVDAMFQKHRYLMFSSKSIHPDGIRARVMVRTFISGRYIWLLISLQSSFGFGQVGGMALVLHQEKGIRIPADSSAVHPRGPRSRQIPNTDTPFYPAIAVVLFIQRHEIP
jgi:hypothetical protein